MNNTVQLATMLSSIYTSFIKRTSGFAIVVFAGAIGFQVSHGKREGARGEGGRKNTSRLTHFSLESTGLCKMRAG